MPEDRYFATASTHHLDTARRPPAVTHYCDWDAPGRHTVPALCGIYIRRRAHANAPTCPDCQRALATRGSDR